MDRQQLLNVVGWVLLREPLLVVVSLIAQFVLVLSLLVPFKFPGGIVFVSVIVPIGMTMRTKIIPKYCKDDFAEQSRRFKIGWYIVCWGVLVLLWTAVVLSA
jgi:hypothetical protein